MVSLRTFPQIEDKLQNIRMLLYFYGVLPDIWLENYLLLMKTLKTITTAKTNIDKYVFKERKDRERQELQFIKLGRIIHI